MKRVVLFLNGSKEDGRVIAVTHSATLTDLLQNASAKLGVTAAKLFTQHGGLIDDVHLIRDDDVLYVSEGEPFISFEEKTEESSGRDQNDGRICRGSKSTRRRWGNPPSGQTDNQKLGVDCSKSVRETGESLGETRFNENETRLPQLPSESKILSNFQTLTLRPKSLPGDWIAINVGGKLFTTTRSTLTNKEPNSMLARMFASDDDDDIPWRSSRDANGAYLIDRSPVHFEPLLNFLRHGQLVLDKSVNPLGVLEEARFFGLLSVVEVLEEAVAADVDPTGDSPFHRRDVIQALMTTSVVSELRFQGVNFSGADLSKLDLRHINLRFAKLVGADLKGANLAYCNLERADLTNCNLDGAILFGAKMVCSICEGASMKGCNFEDPAGSRTNMEGSNMKGCNLEGSGMANVNLRVANLRNANLQNCDLRSAVLAGADLENCTLSGCDLQEANLRGANLTDVAFDLILTPLHCSQFER